jgi:hypothetical protein
MNPIEMFRDIKMSQNWCHFFETTPVALFRGKFGCLGTTHDPGQVIRPVIHSPAVMRLTLIYRTALSGSYPEDTRSQAIADPVVCGIAPHEVTWGLALGRLNFPA